MKKPDERKIGEQFKSRIEYRICKACGCAITELNECRYPCRYDGKSNRPAEFVFTRVYERVETLVEIK